MLSDLAGFVKQSYMQFKKRVPTFLQNTFLTHAFVFAFSFAFAFTFFFAFLAFEVPKTNKEKHHRKKAK